MGLWTCFPWWVGVSACYNLIVMFSGRSVSRVVKFVFAVCLVAGCSKDGAQDSGLPSPGELRISINEFMASNAAGLTDEAGNFPDWIELYNGESQTVDLGGWWLTDDASQPLKWSIPSGVTIESKGFLVFFADNDTDEGPLHADFRLDADAGDIGLFTRDGTRVDSIDSYPVQTTDVSYARMPDGGNAWEADPTSTPGAPNG